MEHSHALLHIEGVPSYVTYSWLAMVILVTVSFIVSRSLTLVPRGLQNFMEALVEALYNFCKENLGEHTDAAFPLIGTLGLYILTCNMMGLIPGFEAPTGFINVTASCALPVFFVYHYFGIRINGVHYINQFLGPIRSIYALPLMIMMFFIELISHLARPLTLSVRLFGNMLSKHIILTVLSMLVPALVPVLFLSLGVLVSFVQAFVFVLLTTLYIAGAVSEAH
ncbi:MAG: F0F1 ATP synthase subunit A [Nitrospirae bacterium]|nr:F0F1 ATP synthase subunit A [Nitrospirota bacterium]